MAIVALDQPFVHTMVIGLGKVSFRRGMAPVTKLGLILSQQELFFLGVMRGVAVKASHVAAGVGGSREMRLCMTVAVAAQTTSACLLPRPALESEYLRLVAAASDVVCAGTMAALATSVRWVALFIERGLPMRSFFPGVVDFFVAGLAGFRSHVFGKVGDGSHGFGSAGGLRALAGGRLTGGTRRRNGQ